MKALVLTYDRNRAVARHMLARYEALWPNHPFTFRIPYQDRLDVTESGRCELVPSPPGIKETVGALLRGLPDDEWIYWCIDDKYPVTLDLGSIEPIVSELAAGAVPGGPPDLSGVLFCRARRLLDPQHLLGHRRSCGGQTLLERRAYEQIWLHQFVRVKVLRHLFGQFPDVLRPARIMDRLKRAVPKPDDHRLWVTESSLAVFGESTDAGVLTENCIEGMRELGIPIPEWQPDAAAPRTLIGLPGADGPPAHPPSDRPIR